MAVPQLNPESGRYTHTLDPGDIQGPFDVGNIKSYVDKWSPIVAAFLGAPQRDIPVEGQQLPSTVGAEYDPAKDGIFTNTQYTPDEGTLVHELAHAYTMTKHSQAEGPVPKWLTEGIADYTRDRLMHFSQFLDPTQTPAGLDPLKDNPVVGFPQAGYQSAAPMFHYLELVHPGATRWLAEHLRRGTYDNKHFINAFGLSPEAVMVNVHHEQTDKNKKPKPELQKKTGKQ